MKVYGWPGYRRANVGFGVKLRSPDAQSGGRLYPGRAEVVGIQLDRLSRWRDHAAQGELGCRPPLGRLQTAVTQASASKMPVVT
jgi:hypothetical protein